MDCNLKECSHNGFGNCCFDDEQNYDKGIPNSNNCPNYYNLDERIKRLRSAYIEEHIKMINEIKVDGLEPDKVRDYLSRLDDEEMFKKCDEINALYESHLDLKAMDEILKEIQEIGADAVRQKYGLSSKKG